MRTVLPSPLLKLALIADAVVSGAVAVLQLAAPQWLSQLLQLPQALLVETGLFLLAYTALLAVLARSARLPSALIGLIVVGNVGWALGCLGLLASGLLAPGALGVGYLAVQALAVLVFAVLEFKGLAASLPAAFEGSMQGL